MSYEPTIIINKKHLEKHRQKIEEEEWEKGPIKPTQKFERKRAAYDALRIALNKEAHIISKVSIVIIQPEGSWHNEDVRDLLDEFEVEYTTEA